MILTVKLWGGPMDGDEWPLREDFEGMELPLVRSYDDEAGTIHTETLIYDIDGCTFDIKTGSVVARFREAVVWKEGN